VPRLQRMPSTLPPHLKLMTLFLGRTTSGVATVSPFLWALASPSSQTLRFDMFRMALVFHHMLHCTELQVRLHLLMCLRAPASVYETLHCR
jgi:hypothetical protein